MIALPSPYSQQAAVLIDLQNMEIDQGTGRTLKLDWRELIVRIENHGPTTRQLERCTVYSQTSQLSVPKQHYLERGAGLRVVRTRKNSDSRMYADAVILAMNHFQLIVFLGGDSDVIPFLPILRVHAVTVEVWAWEDKTNDATKSAVDEFVPLTRDLILPSNGSVAGSRSTAVC